MDERLTGPALAAGSPVEGIAAWLMEEALRDAPIPALFEGCCSRLRAAGLPLWRGHISYTTLHPLYAAGGVTWLRESGAEVDAYEHRAEEPDRWLNSPLYHMVSTRVPLLRRRLAGPEALIDFPVLEEYRAAGATDYLGFVDSFDGDEDRLRGMVGSWTTDRAGGFTDAEIAALSRIQKYLAVAAKMSIKDQIARNVAAAYLGPTAGLRVLDGRIQRGDLDTIHAVIWLSDMRGSTHMAETLSPEEYIARLNDHFEATAGALIAHGGEVLSFLGDGVLGIVPIGDDGPDETEACARAVEAARVALARASGGAPDFGLALHVGDVMYGNIGVPDRLSFSVIGPAVNEAARIEALTKEVGRPVLASARVAAAVDAGWEALGERALPGVGHAVEVFALAN